MLRRGLAILVLVLVAIVAIRLAVGLVVGVVSAVLWILVIAALVDAEVHEAPSRSRAAVGDGNRADSSAGRGPGRS